MRATARVPLPSPPPAGGRGVAGGSRAVYLKTSMRWPWARRPLPPRLTELQHRVDELEERLEWLEAGQRKMKSRIASIRSAEVREERDEPHLLPNEFDSATYYDPASGRR